jgi:hypothetical protein
MQRPGAVCDFGGERPLVLVLMRSLQQLGLSLAAELEPQVAIDINTHVDHLPSET